MSTLSHGPVKGVMLIAALCMWVSTATLAHNKTPASKDLKISDTSAVIYNTPTALSLGQNRLIIRAENNKGQVYGGPSIDVSINLTQGASKLKLPAYWVWVSVGYNGFYVANVNFTSAGQWTASVTDKTGQSQEQVFTVVPKSVVPAIGQHAPLSITKVLSKEVPFADLTSDDEPDPRFYQQTIADAVTSGKPTVVIFATPDLCRTAVCGPVLKEMKQLSAGYDDINFVHIEIYEPVKKTNNELVPVESVIEWHLPSEPWTFLVDAEGRIAARFEGYITADEVDLALTRLQ